MKYLYEATDVSGRTVLGKMDAASENEVQRKLTSLGYSPQSVAAVEAAGGLSDSGSALSPLSSDSVVAPIVANRMSTAVIGSQSVAAKRSSIVMSGNAARVATKSSAVTPRSGTRTSAPIVASPEAAVAGVPTRDLMFFFQQLAALVKSGMTIYTALENLSGRTLNRKLKQAAKDMTAAAHAGQPISDVMARYAGIFPGHVTGMVRAGELGGFLEITLAEIALSYEQNIALYRGSAIPKMLAIQGLFSLVLALPFFGCLFYSTDFAANMHRYVLIEAVLLPLTGLGCLGIKWAARRLQLPDMRRFRDSTSLKMPVFGDLQRQVAIAAFVRMLRKLYHAGVSATDAWQAAANSASNVVIRDRLMDAGVMMQSGASLADAFAATGLFPNHVENMIMTGQLSGEVVQSLDQIADLYQGQVFESTEKARFTILRLGKLAALVLSGITIVWMMHTYFNGVFGFVDKFFSAD